MNALQMLLEEHLGEEHGADIGGTAAEADANATSEVWTNGEPPEENCIQDPAEREAIKSQLPEQTHHVASDKHTSVWSPLFRKITDKYGLSLNDGWNKIKIRHQGSHPWEYHDWVHKDMELADELADGNTQIFLDLFERWVTTRVDSDPLIVRLAYWLCRRGNPPGAGG